MAGGGVALLHAIKSLANLHLEHPDQQVGVNILRRALEEPMRRIAGNAGQDGSVIVEKVRQMSKEKKYFGYDVISGEYVDMIKAGIIDPVKVTRGALDCGATKITEEMKLACVREIAALAKAETSAEVAAAYAGKDLQFGPDYLLLG